MFGMKSRQIFQQLQEVTAQLERVAKSLDHLQSHMDHSARINIERLEIDDAFLNELVFRLESVDIDELSGSLNIGNNFSPPMEQSAAATGGHPDPADASASHREVSSGSRGNPDAGTPTSPTDDTAMKATDKGYLIRLS